jgi:hypothetical protein
MTGNTEEEGEVKLALLAALGFAAVGAAVAAPSYAASSSPPCIPKLSSAGGHETIVYCGPATATIKIGSKTYNFKNGYCAADPKNHIPLQLTLGTISQSKTPVNGGQPLFEMTLLSTSGITFQTVNADYGGAKLITTGTVSAKGTLSGTFAAKGFSVPAHFTGSWNCHGVIWHRS